MRFLQLCNIIVRKSQLQRQDLWAWPAPNAASVTYIYYTYMWYWTRYLVILYFSFFMYKAEVKGLFWGLMNMWKAVRKVSGKCLVFCKWRLISCFILFITIILSGWVSHIWLKVQYLLGTYVVLSSNTEREGKCHAIYYMLSTL